MRAQKYKEHFSGLQKLNADLQWAKNEGDRSELMAGAAPQAMEEARTPLDMIEMAKERQQEQAASLERQKEMLAATENVGTETMRQLKDQTEQMKNIDADIMRVESNLKRADLLVRAFLRRMATDKFILVFLFLIVVGLLTIIIYKAINPEEAEEQGINVPDEITPPVNYQR